MLLFLVVIAAIAAGCRGEGADHPRSTPPCVYPRDRFGVDLESKRARWVAVALDCFEVVDL